MTAGSSMSVPKVSSWPVDFSGSLGHHPARVAAPGQLVQVRCRAAAPSARCSVFAGTCARSPTVRSPSRSSGSSVFGPDAPQGAHRQRVQEVHDLGRADDEQPVGLGAGGGELGDELGAGDADRAGDALLVEDPGAEVLADLRRVAQPPPGARDVEERLVQADSGSTSGVIDRNSAMTDRETSA